MDTGKKSLTLIAGLTLVLGHSCQKPRTVPDQRTAKSVAHLTQALRSDKAKVRTEAATQIKDLRPDQLPRGDLPRIIEELQWALEKETDQTARGAIQGALKAVEGRGGGGGR